LKQRITIITENNKNIEEVAKIGLTLEQFNNLAKEGWQGLIERLVKDVEIQNDDSICVEKVETFE